MMAISLRSQRLVGTGSYPSDKSFHDSWKQTSKNQRSKTQDKTFQNANIIDKSPFFESLVSGHSQRVCKRRLLISPPSSRLSLQSPIRALRAACSPPIKRSRPAFKVMRLHASPLGLAPPGQSHSLLGPSPNPCNCCCSSAAAQASLSLREPRAPCRRLQRCHTVICLLTRPLVTRFPAKA